MGSRLVVREAFFERLELRHEAVAEASPIWGNAIDSQIRLDP